MDTHVNLESPIGEERLATDFALMWTFTSMGPDVISKRILVRESSLADWTRKRTIFSRLYRRILGTTTPFESNVMIFLLKPNSK